MKHPYLANVVFLTCKIKSVELVDHNIDTYNIFPDDLFPYIL